LRGVLGRLNVCSKESMVRQYDHEVQGASVLKPLVGVLDDGPADAAVLRPVLESHQGIAVAHGICPRYSDLDTYAMAACAVDEAVRGIVAVGGDPARIAGLDNFCWCDPLPSPTNPDAEYKLAQLVRAAQAVYDLSVAFGVPLISGKDSMKNDYVSGGTRISIPPTLLFSALGIVPDVRRAVTMDAKAAGDLVYLLGETRDELGGSEYHGLLGEKTGCVPQVRPDDAKARYRALARAISDGLVRSAHDCADGGLAVAVAETAFAGGLGMALDVAALPEAASLAPATLLFAETPSRLVVTVSPDRQPAFEQALAGTRCVLLGEVTRAPRLVLGHGDETWLDEPLAALKDAWQAPLRDL
jgi:phosphoribosylformylglycinamidine synthase